MLISEFIQQLQGLYDTEGDKEIVITIGFDNMNMEPHVCKSTFYDRFEISPYK